MTPHLCISVTFLDPLFHGKGDREEPEWPPSPMRLFQALLAGSRTGCRNRDWSDAKAEAFRWLEQRHPPIIIAPAAQPASPYTLFVPNNDADKEFDRQKLLTSKIATPHRMHNGDTLHYLWPIEEPDFPEGQTHAELLCREARHLLALGWGIDQVVGNGRILTEAQGAALPGQRWRAWVARRAGHKQWRVPTEGSLGDLERVHRSSLRCVDGKQYRPPLKLKRFALVSYLPEGALAARSYAVFELPEGVAFRQVDVVQVAAMLRSLACREEHQKDFQQQFPDENSEVYLAGHVNGANRTPPRFSYLPLPTIGHEHADGMIRRLLIADPYGGDGARARWARDRLRNAMLVDKDGNQRGILLDLWRPSSKGMIDRYYVGPSQAWSSVTPVILPGYDDFKAIKDARDSQPIKAERLLFKALRQAGISIESVADVFLRKAPFWPGAHHPRLYRRPDYLKNFPAWHVHIRFKEPIPGPLAIGAGRHCGLGIFASEAC